MSDVMQRLKNYRERLARLQQMGEKEHERRGEETKEQRGQAAANERDAA